MKSRKHNGIMHISNSFAVILKQSALPVKCLTAGAARLSSKHNVFFTDITQHYAKLRIFSEFLLKTLYAIFTHNKLRKYDYEQKKITA